MNVNLLGKSRSELDKYVEAIRQHLSSPIPVHGNTGEAIQRALDQVASDGGGVVLLLPQTYTVKKTLTYDADNLVLLGHGQATRLDWQGGAGEDVLVFGNGTTSRINIVVKDILVVGNLSALGAGDGAERGIYLNRVNTDQVVINRVKVTGCDIGIECRQAWLATVNDCRVSGCDVGIKIDDACNRITLNKVSIYLCDVGLKLASTTTRSYQVSITDCNVEQSVTTGIYIENLHGFSVHGCNFEGNKGDTIKLAATSSGNQVYGGIIRGNVFIGNSTNSDSAIKFDASSQAIAAYGVIIDGNAFEQYDRTAPLIDMNGGRGCVVGVNAAYDNNYSAVAGGVNTGVTNKGQNAVWESRPDEGIMAPYLFGAGQLTSGWYGGFDPGITQVLDGHNGDDDQGFDTQWTATNITVTADSVTGPVGGTSKADKLETQADPNNYGNVKQETAVAVSDTNAIFSVWLKADSAQIAAIRVGNSTGSAVTTRYIYVDTDWRRYWVKRAQLAADGGNLTAWIFPGGTNVNPPETGTGTGILYAFGPQLETGSHEYPSSYTPCTSGTIARPLGLAAPFGVFASGNIIMDNSGRLGVNTTSPDTPVDVHGSVTIEGDSATFDMKRTGGAWSKLHIDTNGSVNWGSGSGSWDANLYRSAANLLKTDDKLIATAGLGAGNSAAATTPGSVVKKLEVFDDSGNSLGFLAVYDAIT